MPAGVLEKRLDSAREWLLRSLEGDERSTWGGHHFDPTDRIAGYILQAEAFAIDRRLWVPDAAVRIAPVFKRIGLELDLLRSVTGVEERAERLMTNEKAQPDGPLLEFLVALAYRRRWASVVFVPETKGLGRTPDLLAFAGRRRWAAECKMLARSIYSENERIRGRELARPIHRLCKDKGWSLVTSVNYKIPLDQIPQDYLVARVAEAAARRPLMHWEDEVSNGIVRPANWELFDQVNRRDDIYYGSSRMIELFSGYYHDEADHSIEAVWKAASNRPFYATAVKQVSIVSWLSSSSEATQRKAKHFKRTLANAEGQLPFDRPGSVHIGLETSMAPSEGGLRDLLNLVEARMYEPRPGSRLRWVYANYFVPELTTSRSESWAVTETISYYRIGNHKVPQPLPSHGLLIPDGASVPGGYWDSRTRDEIARAASKQLDQG